MPFGLSNAPCTFQKAMDNFLGDIDFVKVYLDDILIHSETEEIHLNHIKQVIKILYANNISINFDKCEFLKKEISFLGHTISAERIKANIDKINPLKEIKPKNKKHIQRVIGIINWYRNFIKNASNKTQFLTEKLSKNSTFSWSHSDSNKLAKIVE